MGRLRVSVLDVMTGDIHINELVGKIRASPLWASTVVIVTYDENGGFWDHVPPPKGDQWGPGTRVPAIVISPFAKQGYVDSTTYETTSITALIEHRWGLAALGTRDANDADLSNAFNFGP